jgi:hypothetical protein
MYFWVRGFNLGPLGRAMSQAGDATKGIAFFSKRENMQSFILGQDFFNLYISLRSRLCCSTQIVKIEGM